jgi:hypothetical protein
LADAVHRDPRPCQPGLAPDAVDEVLDGDLHVARGEVGEVDVAARVPRLQQRFLEAAGTRPGLTAGEPGPGDEHHRAGCRPAHLRLAVQRRLQTGQRDAQALLRRSLDRGRGRRGGDAPERRDGGQPERDRDPLTTRHQAGRSAELDGLDAQRLDRAVAAVGLRVAQTLDDVHPVDDLPEGGVLAVEPRRLVGGDDEELEPFVSGPALAIASVPFTILCWLISSSNV